MPNKRPLVMLATPAFGGQVDSLYASSVLKLQNACLNSKEMDLIVAVQWGDALIPRARQDLVTRFLEMKEATHLLFVDGDIGFEPEQVFRLLKLNADVSAAVYPYKQMDMAKIRSLILAGKKNIEAASLAYTFEVEDKSNVIIHEGFAKVVYSGMGFMLIQRSVLLAMMERYPELRYSAGFIAADPWAQSPYRYALFNSLLDEKTKSFLSEDQSFCQRWTDMGGEIWIDLNSRLHHVGPVVFNGDFTAFIRENSAAGSA